jgi:hypothetical protein
MKNRATVRLLVALVAAIMMASACIEISRISEPSASADIIKTLSTGLWSSNGAINPDACGDFKWSISEINDTSAKGTFSATCSGGISLAGTANGTLNGSILTWQATGLAKTPIGDCSFTVNGTAQLEGTGVRVNYTANTCAGTFSGSELLRK